MCVYVVSKLLEVGARAESPSRTQRDRGAAYIGDAEGEPCRVLAEYKKKR